MKKLMMVLLLCCVTTVYAGSLLGQKNLPMTHKKQHSISLLFVLSANKAILSPNKHKPNTYTLTLINPDKQVSFFADRPSRVDGMLPIQQFAKDWVKGKNSFAKDAPNAALRGGLHDKTRGVAYNFELEYPKYNAEQNTLTYTLIPLAGQKKITSTIYMNKVSLFVDAMMGVLGADEGIM